MKKQYISPETLSYKLHLGSLMQNGSPTSIGGVNNNNVDNPIDVGGNAEFGGSDSRRRSLWDDDEQDEFGY